MQATKYTVTIKIEVLSTAVVPGITGQMLAQYRDEMINGKLIADDGDSIEWKTKAEGVEF